MDAVMPPVNMKTTIVLSLLGHLAFFGLVAGLSRHHVPPRPPEYIPVEFVQLPVETKKKVYIPAQPTVTKVVPASKPAPSPLPVTTTPPRQELPVQRDSTPAAVAPVMSYPATQEVPSVKMKGSTNAPRGVVSAQPASKPETDGQPGPVAYQPVHRLTRLPNFRTRAEPVYPASERMAGAESRVLAEVYLNEHGGVDEVRIRKSGGKVFDQAVITAVRASSFSPGYLGDKPVATLLQIPFTFRLK